MNPDPSLIGKCEFFVVKPFLDAANILVAADEPMRALSLLGNLPGYYRDNPPVETLALKEKIHSLLATPAFYATNPYDQFVRADSAVSSVESTLRGQLIRNDVKAYNDMNQVPHLIDLGPGEYWLAIGLKKLGFKFTYQDIGLCRDARIKAEEFIGEEMKAKRGDGAPTIFVACELIEHLHNESDILVEFQRAKANADIIHISTPKYTFDTRASQLDWQLKGDLGHLRTYTPNDFILVVTGMFPKYKWVFTDHQIMHLRGEKV